MRARRLVVLSLLSVQTLLLAVAAFRHSPVMDEPAHLAAGISHWELGRFELFKVNPPLLRMLAALPVLAAGAQTDWSRYHEGVGLRPEFSVMDDFARANGERLLRLVMLARCGLIPLMVLGGYFTYRWSRELYGDAAGLTALVLWCFCPNLLAYGAVINADAGATSLGVVAGYAFWKWLREPVWHRALVAGLVLGFAELTKTTWVVLFALWPAVWLFVRCHWSVVRGPWSVVRGLWPVSRQQESVNPKSKIENPKSTSFRYEFAQLAMILVLANVCINAGYDFQGSGTRLRNYLFLSRPLTGSGEAHIAWPANRFAKSWLGRLPVPLPNCYVEGIDLQWHDIEVGKLSYLRGRWQDRGWWYWYLYALAVKVPLGTWGLLLLAVGVRGGRRWRRVREGGAESDAERPDPSPLPEGKGENAPYPGPLPEGEGGNSPHLKPAVERDVDNAGGNRKSKIQNPKWTDELVLLAPAVVVLMLVSSQTGFSRYVRYVLPVLPFVFIWASSVARAVDGTLPKEEGDGRHPSNPKSKFVIVLIGFLLAWSVASGLWYAPHWMSYFNELAGGPLGGPEHLVDAQVDWGQDLVYLRGWLDAHPEARPLKLVYFGPIDPRLAGIEFSLPPRSSAAPDDPAAVGEPPDELEPGWYAVSVNFLYGYPHYAPDVHGGRAHFARGAYTYFRRYRPVARAGYSIYIYRVPPSPSH